MLVDDTKGLLAVTYFFKYIHVHVIIVDSELLRICLDKLSN